MSFLLLVLILCLRALAVPVPVLGLERSVNPGSGDYLIEGIHEAQASGAPAIILTMDTPGGLLETTREIVKAELGSNIPVIVWVGPSGSRAGSAGVFITLAAHVAAMAPGSNIGAAHPVSMFEMPKGPSEKGPGIPLPSMLSKDPAQEGSTAAEEAPPPPEADQDVMGDKIMNDTLAWVRSIAEQRGRNVEWAQDSVRKSASITEREALEQGVIDLVALDLPDLVRQLDGRVVQLPNGTVVLSTADWDLTPIPMSLRQQAVHLLGDPNVLFVLVGLGLLALYLEFNKPGLIIPGVVGVIFLVAASVGFSIVPFNIGGLLLVLLGFVLFALEIWIPSYGALTAGGVISLLLGGLLLFEVEGSGLHIDLGLLFSVAGTAGALALAIAFVVLRSHRRRVEIGVESMTGSEAEITRGGEGEGWVRFQGEIWKARWTGHLETGTPVRVKSVDRLRLDVEPCGLLPPNPTRGTPGPSGEMQ